MSIHRVVSVSYTHLFDVAEAQRSPVSLIRRGHQAWQMARAIDLGLFVPVGGANRRQELMGVKLCSEPTKESAMSESRIAKPVKAHHFVGQAISLRDLRSDVQRVNGFNAKIAVCTPCPGSLPAPRVTNRGICLLYTSRCV